MLYTPIYDGDYLRTGLTRRERRVGSGRVGSGRVELSWAIFFFLSFSLSLSLFVCVGTYLFVVVDCELFFFFGLSRGYDETQGLKKTNKTSNTTGQSSWLLLEDDSCLQALDLALGTIRAVGSSKYGTASGNDLVGADRVVLGRECRGFFFLSLRACTFVALRCLSMDSNCRGCHEK